MECTKEEIKATNKLATNIMRKFHANDRSGRLLYLFVRQLTKVTGQYAYRPDDKYRFVVITMDEYNKLKNNSSNNCVKDDLNWIKEMSNNI